MNNADFIDLLDERIRLWCAYREAVDIQSMEDLSQEINHNTTSILAALEES